MTATLFRFNRVTGINERLYEFEANERFLFITVHNLPIAAIGLRTADNHQDRLPYILKMVETLRKGGELPPVIVHPAGLYFSCDDGYHRLWAYTLAEVKMVPAIIWYNPAA